MGREASCRARLAGGPGERWGPSAEGKALLETNEVIFRGAFRARVPLDQIRAVVARAGALTLTWPEGKLELELGAAAEKWADAIRHPRSVLDKLGIAPGLRVALLGGFLCSIDQCDGDEYGLVVASSAFIGGALGAAIGSWRVDWTVRFSR